MTKKVTCLFIIIFLFTVMAFCQNGTCKIYGKIKIPDGKADALTVSLLNNKDSAVLKTTISDKLGEYTLDKLKPGKYLLAVSGVGVQKTYTSVFDLSKENEQIKIPDISMVIKAKGLQGVELVSKKPFIENKIDKTVVNVEASPTSSGLNALEMLEKSPGVSVDNDGNISVKGKSGVIVLVDGKSTYLNGQDLTNYLKNLSANQLDQIEIMTQPSAKYDASGNSGIINFKTKKNRSVGFNGSLNTTAIFANYFKNTNSFNFNFKKNKVNFFGNIGYSHWIGFNEIHVTKEFRTNAKSNSGRFYDQNTFGKYIGIPLSAKAGLDYNLSKKISLGIGFNSSIEDQSFTSSGINNIYDSIHNLVAFNSSLSQSKDPQKNFGSNLNFKYTSTAGDELTADADYIIYRTKSKQFSNNYLYKPDKSLEEEPYLLNGNLPSNIDIYSFKSDYNKTLKVN